MLGGPYYSVMNPLYSSRRRGGRCGERGSDKGVPRRGIKLRQIAMKIGRHSPRLRGDKGGCACGGIKGGACVGIKGTQAGEILLLIEKFSMNSRLDLNRAHVNYAIISDFLTLWKKTH